VASLVHGRVERNHSRSMTMLFQVLREMISARRPAPEASAARPRFLNVGSGSKLAPVPPYFAHWDHVLLDIDAAVKPDLVLDARRLLELEPGQYDAVFCSHNLEHYFRHDCLRVLRGFRHVLKSSGFAEIRVPDLQCIMKHVVEKQMDLNDVLYQSPRGPITVLDCIYGWGSEIESSGNDYYAHKTGFTPKLLHDTLVETGFAEAFVFESASNFEARALAFNSTPTAEQRRLLDLPGPGT
jgi:hypothetical protein